jgi:hypothetical protein
MSDMREELLKLAQQLRSEGCPHEPRHRAKKASRWRNKWYVICRACGENVNGPNKVVTLRGRDRLPVIEVKPEQPKPTQLELLMQE